MSEYRWIDLGNGRQGLRKIKEPRPNNRSSLTAPMIIGGFAEPVQSMADGKWYSTKAGLAASHRASGNPQGVDYVELGHDEAPWVEHKTDQVALREDVRSAIADVKAGKMPEIVTLND